jgi:hypothetical protein
MDARIKSWKEAAQDLAAGRPFDHRQAAQLAAEIARQSVDPALRHAATQALPGLRAAIVKGADRRSQAIAERRFAAIRDVLHALTLPRFGRREPANRVLTPEELHRRLLGLPLDRRLYGPEIREAYKQAAKKAHPDVGGTERAFMELSEARDALMKRL